MGVGPYIQPQGTGVGQQQYYGGYYYYPHPHGQSGHGYAHHGNGDHSTHDETDLGNAVRPPTSHPMTEHYVPYYESAPRHTSPQTIPKVPYPAIGPTMYHPEASNDIVPNDLYEERYPADINQNYSSFYDDDRDTDLERETKDLRNYYIPNKYTASSPSRRRSRRDNYEYETSRGSSPYRDAYSSPERYRSPARQERLDSHKGGRRYQSPVRAYPAAHYQQNRPGVLAPPTYGSREHYAAIHSLPHHAQYYQVHPNSTAGNVMPATSYQVQPTGNGHVQTGMVPVLKRSQSVPMAPMAVQNRYELSDVCLNKYISLQ